MASNFQQAALSTAAARVGGRLFGLKFGIILVAAVLLLAIIIGPIVAIGGIPHTNGASAADPACAGGAADPTAAASHAAVAGWDVATPGPLMHAWTRTDDGWRTTRAVHVRNGPTGAEAQNGDAVLIYAGRVDLLHADGRMTPIRISDHSAPARPGEALFGRGSGGDDLWAYDPATNTAAPVPDIPGVETRIAAGWDARVAGRRGLLPPRRVAVILGAWALAAGSLLALADLLLPTGVRPLAVAAVLLVPLVRVTAAPLAVAWSRHR